MRLLGSGSSCDPNRPHETLATMSFRKYELGTYDDMVAAHRWEVPERYNIARDVCDKHEPDRLAMIWGDWAGNERRVTFGELREMSNRFANVLEAVGGKGQDRLATLP